MYIIIPTIRSFGDLLYVFGCGANIDEKRFVEVLRCFEFEDTFSFRRRTKGVTF